jgi:putative ABC transport system ATP-binding protein
MALELRAVSKSYGRGAVGAIEVDLRVEPGEFVALFGPSGSGKTTLLHLLGLLLDPDAGEVRLDDERVDGIGEGAAATIRRNKLGFVFQSFGLLPLLSAEENVEVALRLLGKVNRQRVRDALAVVGLGERGRHRPDELSGGEQQRVALARALVHAPRYILADEPTGELDTSTGNEILQLLRTVARRGTAVIIATHDPKALEAVDKAYFVRDGRLHLPDRAELEVWVTEGKTTGAMIERD